MSGQQKLADIQELIKYTLFTDYLALDLSKKEVPVSLLIIANAETAKTSLIDQFYPNQGLYYVNDCTAWGIQKNLLDKMEEGKIKRLFIPDLINPTNRKHETVDTLITFLNSYISWEGITSIFTYTMTINLPHPVRGSIISTVTPQDFKRIVGSLAAVGFLSRLVPITYHYTQTTISEIFKDIFEQNDGWYKINLEFPKDRVGIKFNPSLASQLREISKAIGNQAGVYGFRAARALMTLCRAKALSEKRTEVNQEDVERIIYLAKRLISLPPELLPASGNITELMRKKEDRTK
jgi:hypothetical protein